MDLSNFDKNNVTNIRFRFNKCRKLKEIKGINKFSITNAFDMVTKFQQCNELIYLDLSNFNTINVIEFDIILQEYFELKQFDISNFNFVKQI